MAEKHTISCVVENHFGVLARISGLISARAFNIESLTVSATEDPSISRMTIVVDADAQKLEQVKNQLSRLIDVIEVHELKGDGFIDRELLLALVKASGANIKELEALAARYGAKVTHATDHAALVEVAGDTKKVDQLMEELRPHGILKLVRTGRVALEKQ